VLTKPTSGGFGNSCYSCQQGKGIITADEPPTSHMLCLCGNSQSTDIDLSKFHCSHLVLATRTYVCTDWMLTNHADNFVSNSDGYLWCHGHRSAQI
jgi:hypothetical protein